MLFAKRVIQPNWLLRSIFYLFYVVGFVCLVQGQSAYASNDELHDKLATLFEQSYLPGASIAVLKNGEIVYSQVYGYADAEQRREVIEETLFEAASLSKALFAPIVLQLVEEGKLQLDRPLYQYFETPLPEMPHYADLAKDERYRLLTARHVLSHTTGLPNWRSNNEGLLSFKSNPGEAFTYSGEGFELLQLAVEKITGSNLEQLAKARIFAPLKMKNSSYTLSEKESLVSAQPHRILGQTNGKRSQDSPSSAYSLHSNANEYARFMQAIIRNELLDIASHRALLSPQSRLSEEVNGQSISLYWGLGLAVEPRENKTYFWHGGSNMNFKALAVAELESGDGVVFFSNSDLGEYIFPELVDIVLPEFGLEHDFMLAAFSKSRFSEGLKLALALTRQPYEQATKAFRNTSGQLEPEPQRLAKAADALYQQGYTEQANQLIQELIKTHENNADVQFTFGQIALLKGNRNVAVSAFKKALSIDSKHQQAQQMLDGLNRIANEEGTRFDLEGFKDSNYVTLAGTFNGWNPVNLPMTKTHSGWQVNIELPEGKHFYKFVVDGEWIFDPVNKETGEFGGVLNSVLIVNSDG